MPPVRIAMTSKGRFPRGVHYFDGGVSMSWLKRIL
jgi:hypothetical protein